LVFAEETQFDIDKIECALRKIDHIDTRLCPVDVANPLNVKPLQAADIAAYETMHFHKNPETSLSDARTPLRRLETYNVPIALEWALRPAQSNPHLRLEARRHFELLRNNST
jgi:hypothetical protein